VDGIYRNALVVTTAVGCPIKCRYCPQDNFIKSYCKHPGNEIKFLSFTDYKNYLAKVPSGTIVSFTGFVEPFVNSECLKMIQYTLDKGYKVRVFSTMYNQSIADYESFAHHENLKTFDLHLPDTDSNTVFPITERYKELLQHIVFNKPKYGRFWTSLLGVGTQVKEEIRNIIDVTPNAINSVHSLVYENGLNHGNASLSCKYDCSRIDNLQAGIIMLLPNGNITVCTQDWELKHIIGNINEFDDWESILTSPKRINFRDGMTNPQIKNICRTCELAVKVNASDIN
jgi:radical SAM protein with 4Fe4S-binding SPASM domain